MTPETNYHTSPFLPLLTSDAPETALNQIVQIVGESLGADRCFLYVRHPAAAQGKIAFCWCKDDTVPNVIQPDWQDDTTDLPQEDPLFRAALSNQPSVYVDDVDTAPPTVLNRDFEAKTFGHRALIHGHIGRDGPLWGILQPCVFGRPRVWTEADRALVEPLLPQLVEPIARWVMEAYPKDR